MIRVLIDNRINQQISLCRHFGQSDSHRGPAANRATVAGISCHEDVCCPLIEHIFVAVAEDSGYFPSFRSEKFRSTAARMTF